jgi:hypothetical protein
LDCREHVHRQLLAIQFSKSTDASPHSRGAMRPSFTLEHPALVIRGRGECRAPDAPAALRAKVESTQASHHGHTGNTRHSPRNGFNGL